MYMKGYFKESSDLFPENQPVRGNGSELFDKIPVCDKNKSILQYGKATSRCKCKCSLLDLCPSLIPSMEAPGTPSASMERETFLWHMGPEEIKSLIFCCPSTLRAAEAWLTLVLPDARRADSHCRVGSTRTVACVPWWSNQPECVHRTRLRSQVDCTTRLTAESSNLVKKRFWLRTDVDPHCFARSFKLACYVASSRHDAVAGNSWSGDNCHRGPTINAHPYS